MNIPNEKAYLSNIDKERFGVTTVKTPLMKVEDIPYVLDFCDKQHAEFLIARCKTSDLDTVHEMERLGFLLMDTLVYFQKNLEKKTFPYDNSKILIRPLSNGEELIVKDIATNSFKRYFGHYHADRRLSRDECDKVYIDWAYKSCISKDASNHVLIAELGGDIAGFATLRMNDSIEGEGVLFGVSPFCQGKGIYRLLMIGGMNWCVSEELSKMIVSTQITNVAVQKVWTRLGFEPSYSYYTFHKWFC